MTMEIERALYILSSTRAVANRDLSRSKIYIEVALCNTLVSKIVIEESDAWKRSGV